MNDSVSGRRVRDLVTAQGQTLESLGPVLKQFTARLDGIEKAGRATTGIATRANEVIWARGFWGRLRWLVLGR